MMQADCPEFKRLLAKSSGLPDAPHSFELLHGHTAQVLIAAEALLAETSEAVINQLMLDPATWLHRFHRAVSLGAFLHDFGKANNQFQSMVHRQRDMRVNPQSIRHEALSGVLCTHLESLRNWLCPDKSLDTEIVFKGAICSVVGHHLKTEQRSRETADAELTIHLEHRDFAMLLRLGQYRLGLGKPPEFKSTLVWSLSDEDESDFEKLPALERSLFRDCGPSWFEHADEETQRWLAAVKAMVVAADVAGSALPKHPALLQQETTIKAWIGEAINDVLSREELYQLVRERLHLTRPNPSRDRFQRLVEESDHPVTLVRAGCGAGKTAAAYEWAARRAAGRKLFFCYPTTGTASQGFDDYVSRSEIEGALLHSRATVDLETIFGTPEDTQEVDESGKTRYVPDLRLESLQAWSPPLIVCTVDTVLGLMQNNRRGLFSFPAFARAAFVFDEIHSYDAKLFGALLRFLEIFRGAAVLLMTASLPPHMRAALEEICGELNPIRGPKTREDAPRYRLRHVMQDPDTEAWRQVQEELDSGGKVLWIANTVDRAVDLYKQAKNVPISQVCLYHGRFRYFERVMKHHAVIDAFDRKKTSGPVLAITTQVAEMSLDLSADLLISDLAPPAALIQRLGRLNRDEDEPKQTALALVLECSDGKGRTKAVPYVDDKGEALDEYVLAYEWLNALPSYPNPVSQSHLAKALDDVLTSANLQSLFADSTWLDGRWKSQIDTLRAGDSSLPIVLERDEADIRRAGEGLFQPLSRDAMRKKAIRLSLSIPVGKGHAKVNTWRRLEAHPLYRIAPDADIDYCKETGARWRSKK